jgi:hypothetical protein
MSEDIRFELVPGPCEMDICSVCGRHRSDNEQNEDRWIETNMDRNGDLIDSTKEIFAGTWWLCKKCGDILSKYLHQKIEEIEEP